MNYERTQQGNLLDFWLCWSRYIITLDIVNVIMNLIVSSHYLRADHLNSLCAILDRGLFAWSTPPQLFPLVQNWFPALPGLALQIQIHVSTIAKIQIHVSTIAKIQSVVKIPLHTYFELKQIKANEAMEMRRSRRRRMVVISTKANNDGVNGGEDTDANDEKGTRCDAAKTRLTIVSSFNEVNNN